MGAVKQLALALSDPPRRARTAALRSAHFRSHIEPEEALTRDEKAHRQEDVILQFFQTYHVARVTPSELHAHFREWPLTSIRRALSMTAAGLLTHYATDRRPGPYGAKESTWGLA
jgi:hypothetical protein